MALCPECHTMDKEFFAPRCHACNSRIPFWDQVFWQWFTYLTILLWFSFFFLSILKGSFEVWWIKVWLCWALAPTVIYILNPLGGFVSFILSGIAIWYLTYLI